MENIYTLELKVNSRDKETVAQIKETLVNVDTEEMPVHRSGDVETIIAIAASVVKLISELIDLWKKVRSKEISADVVIKNIDGKTLDLHDVKEEEEIHNYVNELK